MFWTDPFAPFMAQMNCAAFLPPTDVTVSESDMVLTMDLPGLTADDLDIQLVDGYLSVKGERRRPDVGRCARWAHAERSFGGF